MISRLFVFAVGVSLIVGCGRSDRPTIRRTTIAKEEDAGYQGDAAPASGRGHGAEGRRGTCRSPGSEAGAGPQAAEAAHPDSSEVTSSEAKEAAPCENAQRREARHPPAKAAATAPAGPGAAAPTSGSKDMPVPKTEATAPAKISRPSVVMSTAFPQNWEGEAPHTRHSGEARRRSTRSAVWRVIPCRPAGLVSPSRCRCRPSALQSSVCVGAKGILRTLS